MANYHDSDKITFNKDMLLPTADGSPVKNASKYFNNPSQRRRKHEDVDDGDEDDDADEDEDDEREEEPAPECAKSKKREKGEKSEKREKRDKGEKREKSEKGKGKTCGMPSAAAGGVGGTGERHASPEQGEASVSRPKLVLPRAFGAQGGSKPKRDRVEGPARQSATWIQVAGIWTKIDAPAAVAERPIAQEVPAQALASSVAEVQTATGDAQVAQLKAARAAAEAALLAVQTQPSAQEAASCGTQ